MKTAKCTLDGKIYTASEFSTLPPNEQSHKRKQLVCVECGASAFFRKASRNGQVACFASRTHEASCSLSCTEPQGLEGGRIDDDVVYNLSATYEVDLNVEKQLTKFSSESLHLSLNVLLRNLVNSIEFRESNKQVTFQYQTPMSISDFFILFDDADRVDDDKVYGFWGVLSDARLDSEGSLWLNSGGFGDFSCIVPNHIVDDFYKYYKLEDEEEISGAFALILGTKKTSANGKSYVRLTDISHVTVRILDLSASLKSKYFINDKKKMEFLLRNHQKGIFDDELGIKRKHYIDKKAAKEWKIKIIKELHPDKNQNDTSLDYDEMTANINKIYNRMVGKS